MVLDYRKFAPQQGNNNLNEISNDPSRYQELKMLGNINDIKGIRPTDEGLKERNYTQLSSPINIIQSST